MTDEYNLKAARGVVAGAKAAALLARSNVRDCLMMAVAALRTNCQRQRVCGASLLSELCVQGGAGLRHDAELINKHGLVSYTAS